jgi:hypothetical protein
VIVARTIDGQNVRLECAASQEAAAGEVLQSLAALARSGTPPRDGLRVRFGWSLITLRTEREGLRVCEPRFAGDAATELSPRLDVTLGVLTEQVAWLKRLGIAGRDAAFDQSLVVAGDALSAQDVFALRQEPEAEHDSGWSVAPVPPAGGAVEMSGLHAMSIGSLVATRSALLAVITLPPGYLVRLTGNRVSEVTAPSGEVVWPPQGAPSWPN